MERVVSTVPGDHHGIEPETGEWCGHCHRTYSTALACSEKRWPSPTCVSCQAPADTECARNDDPLCSECRWHHRHDCYHCRLSIQEETE